MRIDDLATDAVLDSAFAWLCQRRRDYPANADIWSFRRNWPAEKVRIAHDLRGGHYRFEALDRVSLRDGSTVDVWTARDALVLKALTMCLGPVLPVSSRCTHVRGHGGAKAAIRQVMAHLPGNGFVLRTDVRSYYDSIDHHLLLDRLAEHVSDRAVMNLLGQYLRRSICDGGNYLDVARGISLGCPLSPLIAAFYLHELDRAFEREKLFYVRFMDDILILAPTRWKIRAAMAAVRSVLGGLRLAPHPDKTFIGRTEKGFEFLGYRFCGGALGVAAKTFARTTETAARLYEQKGRRSNPTPLGRYLTRWLAWFRGGLAWSDLRPPTLAPLPPPQPCQGRDTRQDERCSCW